MEAQKRKKESFFNTWFWKVSLKENSPFIYSRDQPWWPPCVWASTREGRIGPLANLSNSTLALGWWFCWVDPSGAAVPLRVSDCRPADPSVRLAWATCGTHMGSHLPVSAGVTPGGNANKPRLEWRGQVNRAERGQRGILLTPHLPLPPWHIRKLKEM